MPRVTRNKHHVGVTRHQTLGEDLRLTRQEKKHSQSVAAQLIGVDQQRLARWEKGSGIDLTDELRRSLMRYLGVSQAEFAELYVAHSIAVTRSKYALERP